MISRVLMLGVVLTLALLFQSVVASAVGIQGWRPDLVLLTVVAFALADGPGTGARYGFAAGLVADLLSGPGHLVGLSALVFLLVGDGLGRIRPYLSGSGKPGEVALGALAGATAFGLFAALSLLLDLGAVTPVLMAQGIVATALWTAVLAPLFCSVLGALSRRFSGADAAAASAGAARGGNW